MNNPLITTLQYLQNQSNRLIQWRRETIITQNKNGLHLFAHFYFPEYSQKQSPDFFNFAYQQSSLPKIESPSSSIGIFTSLSNLQQINSLSKYRFLIFDLGDVLTHDTLYQKYLKQKPLFQKTVLFAPDTALFSITDLSHLSFEFMYFSPQKKEIILPEKSLFHIKTANDYHLLKNQKNIHLGGAFVDAFLAQKRFQKCPFKKECTSATCAYIGTHPNQILKCADPLFLTQTLAEFSHEIR